jgi:hypothetical protein
VKGCTGLAMKLDKYKGIFKQMQHQARSWMTEESGFDYPEGQKIFIFGTVSREALGPTQLPIQRLWGVLSSG